MITEGVHDIDEATYHADPCPEPSLSASVAKVLVNRTPRHAWCKHPRLNPQHENEHAQKFDLGSAFHALLLGKGAEVVAIEADDYKTKAAKEARDAARADGLIPMLAGQLTRATAMVEAVRAQILEHEEAARAFAAGLPERTIIWREDNGIWCRALLDWMPESGPAYPDLKSTEASASPDQWGRTVMFNIGCDVQDAFYRRGLRKLGISDEAYLMFLVAELDHPYLIATHRCSPGATAMGDRKVETAIELWGECLKRNRWPGYRQVTASHDPPFWQEQQWADRELYAEDLFARSA